MEEGRPEDQSVLINDVEYFPVNNQIKESLRVQKTEYIRQQLRHRQEQEDALMVKLMQEQRIIDGLREQIDDRLDQTNETSRFNQAVQESINQQVYAMHGVSNDKIEGMREYRNAYFQGLSFAMFFLSIALDVFVGILHGFHSEICMFLLAYTGLEGALLAQQKKRWKILDVFCKGLYLLLLPVMLAMLLCYELKFPEYDLFLPYINIAAIVIVVLATGAYFLYDPYKNAKRKVRDAREHMEEIERQARKEVKKNVKIRKKEEKREQRRQRKEERREARRIRKEGSFSLTRWWKGVWTGFLSLFTKKDTVEEDFEKEDIAEAEDSGKADAAVGEDFGKTDAAAGEDFGKADAAAGEDFGKADAVAGEDFGKAKGTVGEGFGKENAVT